MSKEARRDLSASWQLQALNVSLRVGLKPVLRFGSLPTMRRYMSGIDTAFGAVDSLLGSKSNYKLTECHHGEWLTPLKDGSDTALLYIPGGAFVARSPNIHRVLANTIAEPFCAKALVCRYRLAPEHPYPAAVDDVFQAYRQILDTPGINKVVIAGDSAGGNLALACALRIRDSALPGPEALVLMSPLADLTFSGASRRRNRCKDPLLPAKRSHADARHYVSGQDPQDPRISPVFADFGGLPPILIQVGANEILLDDAVRLRDNALAANVPCDLDIWPKVPHVWQVWVGLPERDRALAHIHGFLKPILETDDGDRAPV